MFRAYCAAEGTEVLLTTRRITGVHRDATTVTLDFTCWCGHQGHTVDPRPGSGCRPVPEAVPA